MRKEIVRSVELPLEEQHKENWGWEDSHECYILDSEFLDLENFSTMDKDELIKLARKMENFFDERGISIHFVRNYGLVDQAFREMDKRDDCKSEVEYLNEW